MRKPTAICASLALTAGVALTGVVASPAAALSPGLSFSADHLSTWQADGVVYAVGQAQGRVLAGGTFGQIRPPAGGTAAPQSRSALAVFNAETGAPDNCQFTLALSGGTPTVRAITTAADGVTVYVGGNFSSVNGVNVARLAALDMVTCQVKPFRVSSISSIVRAVAVTSTGVYFGGDFQTVGGQPRLRFAAANPTTGALLPWVADVDLPGRAVAASPDGRRVAIGGDFFTVNGQDSHSIAVVDGVSGANVRTYGTDFIPRTSVTKAITSDANSFYVGNEGTGGGVFDGSLKIDWATLDQVWRNNCLGATQAITVHKGILYEASHRHDCNSINAFQDGKRNYFTAADASDTRLLQWFPTANDGIGEGIGPRALVVATGRTTGKQYLWSGGEFTRINGVAQQSLTRFGPDDTGNPPTPVVSAQPVSSGAIQVRFRSVVDPDDSDLTYRVFRNGATTPIWTGTASSLWWSRPQVTFTDTTAVAGTSYSYRVTASDGTNTSALSASVSVRAAAPRSDYARSVLTDGAQLYWRYDEATGVWAQDSSGAAAGLNGLYENGVTRGAAGAIAGDTSTSATFDGTQAYVWNDQLTESPNTYSVETWFKTTTTTGGKIVGYGNGRPRTDSGAVQSSGSYDRHVYMDDSGRLTFGVWTGSAATVRSANAYNDGAWHQMVATQGAGGMALYVDGVRVGRSSTTAGQNYLGTWRVGGDNIGGWPNQPTSSYFAGSIDETSVYPSVLSAQQVASHYTLAGGTPAVNTAPADAYGAAVFKSAPDLYWRLDEASGDTAKDSSLEGSTPGAYGANVQLGQPRLVSGAGTSARFTGEPSSVLVERASRSGVAQFSLEGWIKTDTTSGGKIFGFEDAPSGNGSNYDKHLYMTNEGRLVFGVYDGGFHYVQTEAAYNDNVRHHVVASQDSNGLRLFVDGAVVATDGWTGNQGFTGYWRVGGGNLNGWPSQPASTNFAGTVDDVAIYSRGLTADEVGAHFATESADDTAPSTPQGVDATLTDGSAVVTWSAATDDVRVTGYRVHRGTSAGFTVDQANKVADVAGTVTSFTDTSVAAGTYYYKIVAGDAAGNLSSASAAAAVTVTDRTAPSTPTGLAVTVNGTSAALSWAASTDDVGLAGYRVHRGATADFVANASSKIVDTSATSYTDADLAPGTYYYRVVAVDTADNTSAASAAVAGRVSAPAQEPVVRTVAPSADAMVLAAAATTNYGTNNQLSSRGGAGTSPISSYLAFDLPAAPEGMVLSEATLRVRTSTDPTATSPDTHPVRLLSSGTWTESGITWNNRPTQLGDQLGVVSGATALNTAYAVALSPSALQARLGTSATFVMTGDGLDNLRISSKEATSTAARPSLVLTYTAR